MTNYDEMKKELHERLSVDFDAFKEKQFNLFMDYLMRHQMETETQTVKIPKDKIVLTAKAFSKIVNALSIAENNGCVEKGLLGEVLADLQETQSDVEFVSEKETTPSRGKIENLPHRRNPYKGFYVNQYPFFDWFRNM